MERYQIGNFQRVGGGGEADPGTIESPDAGGQMVSLPVENHGGSGWLRRKLPGDDAP